MLLNGIQSICRSRYKLLLELHYTSNCVSNTEYKFNEVWKLHFSRKRENIQGNLNASLRVSKIVAALG